MVEHRWGNQVAEDKSLDMIGDCARYSLNMTLQPVTAAELAEGLRKRLRSRRAHYWIPICAP